MKEIVEIRFGKIKHLLNSTLPNIKIHFAGSSDVGINFASPQHHLSQKNKSDVVKHYRLTEILKAALST